jgi:hypothetical protein
LNRNREQGAERPFIVGRFEGLARDRQIGNAGSLQRHLAPGLPRA